MSDMEQDAVTIKPMGAVREVIRGLIRRHDTTDAGRIADEALSVIPDALRNDVVVKALAEIVKDEQRRLRNAALARAEIEAQEAPRLRVQSPADRERQAAKVREIREGELADKKAETRERIESEFFNSWVDTPAGPKFLGDCTAADLRWSAAQDQALLDGVQHSMERKLKFADHLDASRHRTLRRMGYASAIRALANPADIAAGVAA